MAESEMIVIAVFAVLAFVVAMYAVLKMFCLEDEIVVLKNNVQDVRKELNDCYIHRACAKARLNQMRTFDTAQYYDGQK